jgi:hypothetical protein
MWYEHVGKAGGKSLSILNYSSILGGGSGQLHAAAVGCVFKERKTTLTEINHQ